MASFKDIFHLYQKDLSAADPQMVILKSVQKCLSDMETLIFKKSQCVLRQLPSYCGVFPQKKMLPWGFFQLTPKKNVSFKKNQLLFLKENNPHQMVLQAHFDMHFTQTAVCIKINEQKNTLTLICPADCTFYSSASCLSPPSSIWLLEEKPILLPEQALTLSAYGKCTQIDLHLSSFSEKKILTVQLCWEKALNCKWSDQIAAFSWGFFKKKLMLGALQGEPWEEIALPEALCFIPSSVILQDETQTRLIHEKKPFEINSLEENTPYFLIDHLEQKLIFPAAHLFAKGKQIQVILSDVLLTPHCLPSSLKTEDLALSLFSQEQSALPAESTKNYHERFFDLLQKPYHTSQCTTKTLCALIVQQCQLASSLKIFSEKKQEGFHIWIGPKKTLLSFDLSMEKIKLHLKKTLVEDTPLYLHCMPTHEKILLIRIKNKDDFLLLQEQISAFVLDFQLRHQPLSQLLLQIQKRNEMLFEQKTKVTYRVLDPVTGQIHSHIDSDEKIWIELSIRQEDVSE